MTELVGLAVLVFIFGLLIWLLRRMLLLMRERPAPPEQPRGGVNPPKEPAVAKRIPGLVDADEEDEADAEEEKRFGKRVG